MRKSADATPKWPCTGRVRERRLRRGCCADGSTDGKFGEALYDVEERGDLPNAAVLASLGCGNPTAVAELHERETVLDLARAAGST